MRFPRTKFWSVLRSLLIALSVTVLAISPSHASKSPTKKSAAKPAAAAAKKGKAVRTPTARAPNRADRAASRKVAAKIVPARPSMGQAIGLHNTTDPLDLKSSVALVIDQDTNQVLFSKNSGAVLPIASITKLMTAVVVAEAALPMDEMLPVESIDGLEPTKSSRSRLTVGTHLTRGELLHLALMASENRAAYTLGRHYPGGMDAFVSAMNRKAADLGMGDTRYVEPTGLSSQNQSSAKDLTVLVRAAMLHPMIRELSTSQEMQVAVGNRQVQFHTTNGLVRNPSWEIGLQKTGYISEAGRCLVMQAKLAGRQLIMVLLDSAGRYSRMGDAERIRHWLTESGLASKAAETVIR
jgi:serine-type D-Ala-D-Ala endopeptidase (penicillin-binding protein 7)